jgi:Haemolysin secretion/activation protein ShlB/FhaC/HecB
MKKFLFSVAITLQAVWGCAQSDDLFHLYLVGDAGLLGKQTYKETLKQQLSDNDGIESAIVFLGDNIYPKGMPDNDAPSFDEAANILQGQIDLFNGKGDIFFIPGNHDWKQGHRNGLNHVLNQKAWIDSLRNPAIKFLPDSGCPGPVEVILNDQLVLLIIDTQWFLHPFDKPNGETSLCESKSIADVIIQMEGLLRKHKGKRVVIAAHHPVMTYGSHGGRFSFKDHIFPLTSFKKNLFVPLPGLGTVHMGYRKFFGNIQDVASPIYKQWSKPLREIMEKFPGTIYASGHEHSLQYMMRDSIHYVVSGAGSKSGFVRKVGYSKFAEAELGYSRLVLKKDNSIVIEFFSAGSEAKNAPLVYSKKINAIMADDGPAGYLPVGDSVLSIASSRYGAGKSKKRWFGANYREEWAQQVKAPVFDIGKEKGGLTVLQRGGGNQSLSLRLKDSNGREFTLRSLEKFPEKAVPEPLKNTFAEDLVQDQISAAHPYAALVVPSLAEAAGVYHTNPKLVYIPNDPRLGAYRNDFKDQLMIFEERPDGSGEGQPFFGQPDNIISTGKLLEKLQDDNDNRVDQETALRARVFDLWIGDWDRHDDQWRWGQWKGGKGNLFRPIPRDRDQAFFVNEGIMPRIWSRKWAFPAFEGFDKTIRWSSGPMFSGRYFDRSFLTGLSREDWKRIADDLVAKLPDPVIESAIMQWPKNIFSIHGETIVERLKARREILTANILEHYKFVSKTVDVVGTSKKETFAIETLPNGHLRVSMSKSGGDEKKLYAREFDPNVTKEVRLYGMAGNDTFEWTGPDKAKVKVRIIGGEGMDKVNNSSSNIPIVYDGPEQIEVQGKIKNKISNLPNVNEYDRKAFRYDKLTPLIVLSYNIDDGVFLGGGFIKTNHGFRKVPFKSRHQVSGSYALNTTSFNFKYDGRFTELLGKWSLELDVDIKSPNYVNNFFGFGNESRFDKKINEQPDVDVKKPIDFYRLRFKEYLAEAKLARDVGKFGFVKAGSSFQFAALEDADDRDRFIQRYSNTLPEPIVEVGKSFGGLVTSWGVDNTRNQVVVNNGIKFIQSSRWMAGINNDESFASHNLSASVYHSFRSPARVTYAFRAGGGMNTGNYQVYQAQILDGKSEVRGFRKTRFYGDKEIYFNSEVRIKLANVKSYLFPASLGILGFYDIGRVWYRNENGVDPTATDGDSRVWHKGFGGGFWFTPFNFTAVSLELARSKESTLAYFRLGFLF